MNSYKTREQMMRWLLEDLKFLHARPHEAFEGYELNSTEGIWVAAEYDDPQYHMDGYRIFDYYQFGGGDSPYDLGVLMKFKDLLEKYGWYLEWNDPGTAMLFPDFDNELDHKLNPEDYAFI